jgi:hypothetical protein
MNPFEYVNAINLTKKDLMIDDLTEKSYSPYMVNRSLSYFPDTVALANVMNRYHQLDKKLQFSFLLNIVRKRKRFSKWDKQIFSDDLEVVKEYYGYSNEKAKSALSLLTPIQIMELRKRTYKGGRN